MRLQPTLVFCLAATSAVTGSSWFPGTKAVYNKWHETELERWLSDHGVPFPSPSDRKDLENLVEKNWNTLALHPYKKWDTAQLSEYLRSRGQDVKEVTEEYKDSLISQVQDNWYEGEEKAQQSWASTKDWILDSWSESQLKAFCDKHGIPAPQPRHRDTLLQKARAGYESVAIKLGETASYPGDWLYQTWSESDLKAWLDKYGLPVPQPTARDQLIAAVRRNSRIASLKAKEELASASSSARAAYATLTDMVIDAWSESQLKSFCDKNNIAVPQGTRENELRALVRKHRAELLGDNIGAKASSAFGAATSNVGDQYAKASDAASSATKDAFNGAVNEWSRSRLKAYLDARGVPVPQASSLDSLRAQVRKHSYKAASGWSAWTFDDFSRENIQDYLIKHGDAASKAVAKKRDVTREELVSAAASAYSSASTAGGSKYASATSYLSTATAAAEKDAFNAWSHSDLKAYLDSCGIKVPQGSRLDELKALARRQATYFKYGTSSPAGTAMEKIRLSLSQGWTWVTNQARLGRDAAGKRLTEAGVDTGDKVKGPNEEL